MEQQLHVLGRRHLERHRADAEHERFDAQRLPVVHLLAQAGVPLTGGFVAKLAVFSAAVSARQYSLALIGMLAAVIGAYVYLRIVLAMYAPGEGETAPAGPRIQVDAGTGIALAIAMAAVLFLGIVPAVVLNFARDATQLLAR